MSLDRKLSERCRIGCYRYECDEIIVEVFKIAVGSLQSEKEATWDIYVCVLRKRWGIITEDWEEMVRAVGKQAGVRGGMKVTGEVETFFSVRWFSKGKCRWTDLPQTASAVFPSPSSLVLFHIGLVPLDLPWVGNSKSRARDLYRSNFMLPF